MKHLFNLTNTQLVVDGGKYVIPPGKSVPLYEGDDTGSVGVQTAVMRQWAIVGDPATVEPTTLPITNMTPSSLKNWEITDADGKPVDVFKDPNMDIDGDPAPVALSKGKTKAPKAKTVAPGEAFIAEPTEDSGS